MHGNVAEWVEDTYHPNYEGAPVDGSVWLGGDLSYRVVRGGSYGSYPNDIRSADRRSMARTGSDVGFRGVRMVLPPVLLRVGSRGDNAVVRTGVSRPKCAQDVKCPRRDRRGHSAIETPNAPDPIGCPSRRE